MTFPWNKEELGQALEAAQDSVLDPMLFPNRVLHDTHPATMLNLSTSSASSCVESSGFSEYSTDII